MSRTIESVATDPAATPKLERLGTRWSPCPKCHAETGGRGDKRGPVKLTEYAEGKDSKCKGEAAWYCVRCGEGGNLYGLARLLGVEVAQPVPGAVRVRRPKPETDGTLDVGAAWADLQSMVTAQGKRAAVDWLHGVRGWPVDIAAAAAESRSLIMLERPMRNSNGPGSRLARMCSKGYGALIALYDGESQVRSVERRWTRLGPPPDGRAKAEQLGLKVRGSTGHLMFGTPDAAVAVLQQAGTVWMVEGSIDWLAADTIAARTGGCAISAAGAGQLAHAAGLVVERANRSSVVPGKGLVAAVADPNPVGLEGMRKAATRLLDVARARLRQGFSVVRIDGGKVEIEHVDLSDALQAGRSAEALTAEAVEGDRVVAIGDLDGYPLTASELARHLYRLPLTYVYEAAHWGVDWKATEKAREEARRARERREKARARAREEAEKADDPVAALAVLEAAEEAEGEILPPAPVVKRWSAVNPPNDLFQLVRDWFLAHGAVFTRDDHDTARVYFDRTLHDLDSKPWFGRLYRIGHIPTSGQGKALIEFLVQWAFGEPRRQLLPWSWGDDVEMRLHLHDDEDRVVIVQPGKVHVARNGTGGQIHRPTPMTVKPMRYIPAIAPATVSRLLRTRLARWLTLPPALRLLSVCFDLLTPARQLRRWVPMKPLKWCLGPAGNGKSEALKMSTALWYGAPALLAEPTPRSLFTRAAIDPYQAIDNPETANRSPELVQFFLIGANEGAKRIKRRRDTDTDIVTERIECLSAVSTIEPPDLPELVTRSLVLPHDLQHADPAYADHDPIAELLEVRDVIVSGVLDLWAHRVLPRLQAGDAARYAGMVGKGSPVRRQRITWGTMAVIADELGQADPRWGFTGETAMRTWVDTLGKRAEAIMASTDPIGAGLEGLRHALDAVQRTQDGAVQGWEKDDRFKVDPLFLARAPDGEFGTTKSNEGPETVLVQRHARRLPVVVGFTGSYEDIFRDIGLAARDAGDRAWAKIPNQGVLQGRWSHVLGWERRQGTPRRRGRRGPRLYDIIRADMLEPDEDVDAEGGQL